MAVIHFSTTALQKFSIFGTLNSRNFFLLRKSYEAMLFGWWFLWFSQFCLVSWVRGAGQSTRRNLTHLLSLFPVYHIFQSRELFVYLKCSVWEEERESEKSNEYYSPNLCPGQKRRDLPCFWPDATLFALRLIQWVLWELRMVNSVDSVDLRTTKLMQSFYYAFQPFCFSFCFTDFSCLSGFALDVKYNTTGKIPCGRMKVENLSSICFGGPFDLSLLQCSIFLVFL